jgi:hypothetical protein
MVLERSGDSVPHVTQQHGGEEGPPPGWTVRWPAAWTFGGHFMEGCKVNLPNFGRLAMTSKKRW